MCASYGLDAGDRRGAPYDLPPLGDLDNPRRLAEWARHNNGTARITGRHERNLNPIITARDGGRTLEFGWWWLHVGAEPARFSAFNSRDDRLMARWRRPFQHRALLPADRYVERGATFAVPDRPLFAMAAITTRVPQDDGPDLVTYSLVTRDAVGEAREVHPRMPLILPEQMHDTWLDLERRGDEELVDEAVAMSEDISHAVRIIAGSARDPRRAPTLF